MGRETKTFRQNGKSASGNRGYRSYSKINHLGGWGQLFNVFRSKKGGRLN